MRSLALLVLVAVLLAPVASAQLPDQPEAPHPPDTVGFDFSFDGPQFQRVRYLGSANFNYTLHDLSRDSTYAPEAGSPAGESSVFVHVTQLRITAEGLNGEPLTGWVVSATKPTMNTFGGTTDSGSIRVDAGPGAAPNYLKITVNVTFYAPNQDVTLYETEILNVQLEPFYFGYVQVEQVQTEAGQDDVVNIPVRVYNYATYYDTYELNVSASPDFQVAYPSHITLDAQESQVINVSVRTPKGKLYELSRIEQLTIGAHSVNEPSVEYTQTAIVLVRGAYVSKKWIPMFAMIMLCGVLAARQRAERRDERREERGGPRRPRVKPRERVMMRELKRRDPEAYKQKRAELKAIYVARRDKYKSEIKEQEATERAQAKQVRAEAKAERKRRKAQKKEDKKRRKIEAKEHRKQRKVERKKRKVLKKEKKKLEKKLGKKRAKKEKADAKQAKKRERQENREAKKRARQEKRKQRKAKGPKRFKWAKGKK